MKKTKLYFKKSLSVFMAAVMLMTAWVFVAPTEAEAATATKTLSLSSLVAITNGEGSRADYDKIVICSDGEAGNTTVGNATFDISSLPDTVNRATLKLNTGNHGGTLVTDASVKVFVIDPSDCQYSAYSSSGCVAYNNIANVYGGNYNAQQGVTNAYNYYGVKEADAIYTFSQSSTGQHQVDITNAVNTAKAKGQSRLCLAFIMPAIYNDGNGNSWSDTHINVSGTNLVCEYEPVSRYYIKYVVNVTSVSNNEKDYNLYVSYKTNNGQGVLVENEVLFDRDSISMGNTNDYVLYEGYIDGFPTELYQHMAFPYNTNNERQENFRMYIGSGPDNLTSYSILSTSGNSFTYKNGAQDNHMPVQSGYDPYQSSISGMSNLSVTVGKNGQGQSSVTTGTVYDQYGVVWYQAPTYTISSSSTSQVNVSGISAVASGKGAYVQVTNPENVFRSEYGYDASTGKVTLYLRATSGSASASVPITITAPKYSVSLEDFAGNTVKTYTDIGYYKQSVTLTDLPANTATAQIAGDEAYHQPYKWPDNTANAFNLDGDTTYKEEKAPVESHSWSDWTQNADNHSRTCSVCGYVQTQNHIVDYTKGYETKAETCTEDGVMTYDCAVCGKTAIETSVINNITGHNFSGDAIENVTGENGNHWRKCSRCDAYGWAGIENKCENHNWDKNGDGTVNATDATSSKASTCKEAGYETYTCKVCNATWTKTLDYASHTITATAKKDVTNLCGGDGNEAFWTCSVCNRVWKDEALTDELTDTTDADSDGIPDALETKGPDHNFTGAYVSASSGKDGTHYRQCARFTQCKTYGPEEKHTWGDPAVTEATCEKAGKRVYTCTSGCGQTYEETIDKVAHSMTKHDAVEAKCGVAGSIEYYSCSICGKNYSDANGTTVVTNTVVPALEHKWTAHHDYDKLKTPATCQAAAVYHNHCDYCKTQLVGAEHSYGEKDTVNGHNFNGAIVKNADGSHSYKCTVDGCTETGAKTTCAYTIVVKDEPSTCHTLGYTITKCEICGNENRVEKTAYDFDNHDGGTEVRFATPAKCNTDGYTGDTFCLGCNTKIKQGTSITADPTVHPHENMQDYGKVDSTCQKEGTKAYRYCDQCGTYEIAKETIAKKAHKFTTYTSNNDGTHTAICDTCDAAVATPATDTNDCSGGTANCVDKKVCTVCKAEYGEVDSTNHKTVKIAPEVKATCQTEGTEAYRYCEACGKNIDEIKKTEKLPHVYDKWISNGDGTHSKTCTLCDPIVATPDKQTENCNGGIAYCDALARCKDCRATYGELDKTNHSTEANTLKDVVDATCQKEGFSGNYRYNCCDAIKEAGKVTEKLAHKFDIEVEGSRVAATCIAKGEVTYKCSTCVETDDVKAATEKKELPIDAKNHATPEETVTKNKKAATCESDGHTGDVYYKCCYVEGATAEDNRKALKEKGTTIKANGQHVYGDPIPEYMIAEIKEIKDADGNVTGKEIVLKTEEPDYDAKIKARREDSKWYHAQQCTICGEIVYDACFTYAHTYNCKETDICEICEGLCSLIDENKHTNLIEIPEVPATPTTDGTKAYYKCADCGKFFLDDAGKKGFDPTSEEGKKLITISKETADCEHNWPDTPNQTVEPACGEAGYKLFVCTICGDEKKEEIPATSDSHKWSETYKVTKEPTCGSVGYEALYCTECGKFKPNSTVTISATGKHNYKLTATHPGTSCTDPTVETYECDVCGKTKTETVYDGAAAHEWGEWVNKGGSCASGVILERSCNKCSAKEQKKEENNDHSYEVIVRVNPTCEEDGYQIEKCKNCGIENRTELPKDPDAPEHVINENKYKTVEKATCEAAEQREYVCLLCGEKVIRFVGEPLDHVWLLQPAEIATCTRPGHREYYRCVRCEQPYDDGKGEIVIEQLKHEDGDGDGKCDECNSKLYNAGESNCGCMCHKEGWLMKLIYKILNFFWKLFKINPSCDCGATHY